MQFYLPLAARVKGAKFNPRHFVMLADFFGSPEWLDDLTSARPGAWTMVIRAPGSYGFGRELAARKAGGAYIFERLTADELRALEQLDGTLLLDLGWEALFPRADVVSSLISGLAEFSIDPARVCILHSNLAARRIFIEHWREQTDAPAPRTLEFPNALALCVVFQQKQKNEREIEARKQAAIRRTREGSRSKLFVSFNGEVRPHRLFIVASLLERELLERGHVSLLYRRKGRDETDEEFRELILRAMLKLPQGSRILDAARLVLERLPLTLDIEELSSDSLEEVAWTSQNPELYDDSNISIVIDTSLNDPDLLFVTEKVLKPIINYSPFLLLGNPGNSSLLRDYGFQTFEPEIQQPDTGDENAALSSAMDEITRLSLMSPQQLADFSRALMDRCAYNAHHFWTNFPERLASSFKSDVLSALSRGSETAN